MKIIEITSREFREKQRAYFELADKGEKVIIRRGKKQAYILTPIQSDDIQLSPEMETKIQLALQEAQEGKTTKVETKEKLRAFLDSL